MVKSGITREELIQWGGEEVFNQALAICNSGDVSDVTYNDDTLEISGKIEQPSGWAMPVKFKLEAGGRIHSECPCITNQKYGQVCPHVVAIGLALTILEMEDEESKSEVGVVQRNGSLFDLLPENAAILALEHNSYNLSTVRLRLPTTTSDSDLLESSNPPERSSSFRMTAPRFSDAVRCWSRRLRAASKSSG